MNILIILEGVEEELLFDLAALNGFSNKFNVRTENVIGAGNIAPLLQSEISNEYNDCIICIYDVDNKQSEANSAYSKTRKAIKEVLNNNEDFVDAVSFCTNPNILLFILLGADTLSNLNFTKTSKKINTDLLHKFWPKIGNKKAYDASEWQIKIIRDSYKYGTYSYKTILENAKDLDTDYKNNNPASNVLPLLNALINGDINFFDDAVAAINLEEKNDDDRRKK